MHTFQEYRGQDRHEAAESLLRDYAAVIDWDVDSVIEQTPPPDQPSGTEPAPTTASKTSLSTGQKRRLDLLKKVSAKRPAAARGGLALEVANYMSIRMSDAELLDFNVLHFWKNSTQQYPILAKLARALFCTPATAALIERVWSEGGLIITAKRSRLAPNNFRNLIFTNCNFKFFKEVSVC